MNGAELLELLREWYKPTKQGEEARQILGEDGAMGENVEKVDNKKKAQH